MVEPHRPAECAVLDGRQQVSQPVVVQRQVEVIGIARQHVALADLGDDRHRPDEIRREVGTVGPPLGQVRADLRIRPCHHGGHQQQEEADGQHVASAVPRNVDAPPERRGAPRRAARGKRGHRQPPGRPAAGAPDGQQGEAAERVPERRPEQQRHGPARGVIAVGTSQGQQTRHDPHHPNGHEPGHVPRWLTDPGGRQHRRTAQRERHGPGRRRRRPRACRRGLPTADGARPCAGRTTSVQFSNSPAPSLRRHGADINWRKI